MGGFDFAADAQSSVSTVRIRPACRSIFSGGEQPLLLDGLFFRRAPVVELVRDVLRVVLGVTAWPIARPAPSIVHGIRDRQARVQVGAPAFSLTSPTSDLSDVAAVVVDDRTVHSSRLLSKSETTGDSWRTKMCVAWPPSRRGGLRMAGPRFPGFLSSPAW